MEEGRMVDDAADEPNGVRCGTGIMWAGEKERSAGWRGAWWERFIGWLRRLLC